jgi:hypothetical protein
MYSYFHLVTIEFHLLKDERVTNIIQDCAVLSMYPRAETHWITMLSHSTIRYASSVNVQLDFPFLNHLTVQETQIACAFRIWTSQTDE